MFQKKIFLFILTLVTLHASAVDRHLHTLFDDEQTGVARVSSGFAAMELIAAENIPITEDHKTAVRKLLELLYYRPARWESFDSYFKQGGVSDIKALVIAEILNDRSLVKFHPDVAEMGANIVVSNKSGQNKIIATLAQYILENKYVNEHLVKASLEPVAQYSVEKYFRLSNDKTGEAPMLPEDILLTTKASIAAEIFTNKKLSLHHYAIYKWHNLYLRNTQFQPNTIFYLAKEVLADNIRRRQSEMGKLEKAQSLRASIASEVKETSPVPTSQSEESKEKEVKKRGRPPRSSQDSTIKEIPTTVAVDENLGKGMRQKKKSDEALNNWRPVHVLIPPHCYVNKPDNSEAETVKRPTSNRKRAVKELENNDDKRLRRSKRKKRKIVIN